MKLKDDMINRIEEGSLELSTLAGTILCMDKDAIVFMFWDKVITTIQEDSSEEDIFKGLREFISVFDANLQEMIRIEVDKKL